MKPRILYFIQLPPPVHGVTSLNNIIYHSERINYEFDKSIVRINFSKQLSTLGKFSLAKLFKYISLNVELFFKILRFRPQLVYFTIVPTGRAFFRDLTFVSILKLTRCKVIYHLHGQGISKQLESNFTRRMLKYAFSNSNIIYGSAGLIKKELEPLNLKNSKIWAISNGISVIDTEKYEHTKNDKIRILYLSNTQASKGMFVLLNAMKSLYAIKEKINLDIVGGSRGKENDNLIMDFINKYKLSEFVHFHGPQDENSKYGFLKNADIFVLPTLKDTFPLAVIEAMQFELPVITTNIGALPEIVQDGLEGLICERNNSKDLAEKMQMLIENDNLRKSLSQNARKKFLEKYTLPVFEQNISKAFNQILENVTQ